MNKQTNVAKSTTSVRACLFIGMIFILLTGCGGPNMGKPETGNESLIIGYLDTSEAPGSFSGVTMKKIQPPDPQPYVSFWINDGLFLGANLKPGIYKMFNFRTRTYLLENAIYTHPFPQNLKNELDTKIERPGIYYVGSWKYKLLAHNPWAHAVTYDLVPIEHPNELELLQRILPHSSDSYWTNMIRKRISELQK